MPKTNRVMWFFIRML